VSVVITDSDESLETGSLTGARLFLDGHDLQNLVFQSGAQEKVDDFELLDRQRVQINFFQPFDLSFLDQTTELGDGDPFLLVLATATGSTASTSTTASTTTAATTATAFSAATTAFATTATTFATASTESSTKSTAFSHFFSIFRSKYLKKFA
jgi:hypothetical protein